MPRPATPGVPGRERSSATQPPGWPSTSTSWPSRRPRSTTPGSRSQSFDEPRLPGRASSAPPSGTASPSPPGSAWTTCRSACPACRPRGRPRPPRPGRIGAVCGGVEVWSLYVPNGRAVDDPHFDYKLHWLAVLRDYARSQLADRSGRADRVVRRLQHRAHRRRRLERRVLPGLHPHHRPGAAGLRQPGRRRLHRRGPPVPPRTGRLHLLGLHPAEVPEAAGHADRLRPGHPGAGRAGHRRVDRPRGTQGQGRVRPRAGDRRAAGRS